MDPAMRGIHLETPALAEVISDSTLSKTKEDGKWSN